MSGGRLLRWRFVSLGILLGATAGGCGAPRSDEDREPVTTTSENDTTGTYEATSAASDGSESEGTAVTLEIAPDRLRLDIGSTRTVTLVVRDANGSEIPLPDGVIWKSTDDAIAIVEDGHVTAVGTGDASVTASLDGVTVDIPVRVRGFMPALHVGMASGQWANGAAAAQDDGWGLVVGISRNNDDISINETWARFSYGPDGWSNLQKLSGNYYYPFAASLGEGAYVLAGDSSQEIPKWMAIYTHQEGLESLVELSETNYEFLSLSRVSPGTAILLRQPWHVIGEPVSYAPSSALITREGIGPFRSLSSTDRLAGLAASPEGNLTAALVSPSGTVTIGKMMAGSDTWSVTETAIPVPDGPLSCLSFALDERGDGALMLGESYEPPRLLRFSNALPVGIFLSIPANDITCGLALSAAGRIFVAQYNSPRTRFLEFDPATGAVAATGSEEFYSYFYPVRAVTVPSGLWLFGGWSRLGGQRFDDEKGWQPAVEIQVPPTTASNDVFAPVARLDVAPDGSMILLVQNDPYGCCLTTTFAIAYR